MPQQLHYTIDSFELNYEAATGTTPTNILTKRNHMNKRPGGRLTAASDVVYDTICFELPTYFTQSTNSEKSIEIEYIHLLQRPNGTTTTTTTADDGSSETVERTIVPGIATTGEPILTTTTTTTEIDTGGNTTTTTSTEITDETEWNTVPSTMHSDLVQFRPSADSYVMSTNVMYNWQKKFTLPDAKSSFDIWFRDLNGFIIDMDPMKTRIIIELLLTF